MDKELRLIKIFLLLITLILIIVTIFNSENTKQRYLKTFDEITKKSIGSSQIDKTNNEILNKDTTSGNFYIISPTHHNYFLTSLKMFNDKKWFGHGPKSFRYLCKDDRYAVNVWSCSTHPHNYYIQLLAEFGIIGFIFLFSVFIFFVFKSLIFLFSKINNRVLICIYSFFVINLWPLTSTGNFFNNWLSILIYIPFSFYLFNLQKKNDT